MIVITGAAGFVGSALAWHFNRLGRTDLWLVDELGRDQKYANLAGLDFCDYAEKGEFLERLAAGPVPKVEAVFHLGACSSTTESNASYLMRNNFAYTRALAKWCLARGVRMVYASSAATYGNGERGYSEDVALLPRLQPLNAYAMSKHAFDLWAWHAGALDKIAGLKYFNVFGPNEYHKAEMRSMVLRAFEQIQNLGRVRLFRSERAEFADGEQERDFIYVKDAVAMTAWFLDHPEANGIFNIGSGRARTWNDLARAAFAALGRRPARVEYFSMPAELRDKYQYSTTAEMRRLAAAGGPATRWTLETAVADYIQNYLWPGHRRLTEVREAEPPPLPAAVPVGPAVQRAAQTAEPRATGQE
jgi:ADP-L-glycero-D-manno-heptose 6-epimerase